MSPPGKRRHNELNAAPPPETPRGTGATGGGSDRDVVHSGESFCIRVKAVSQLSARHDPNLAFPSEGKPRIVRGRTFNSPRFDLSALCGLYRSFPRSRKKEKNNHPTHHLQSTHIPTNEMYLFFKHHKIRGEIVDFFSKKYYDSLCWQQ